jgi:hypothetical protein
MIEETDVLSSVHPLRNPWIFSAKNYYFRWREPPLFTSESVAPEGSNPSLRLRYWFNMAGKASHIQRNTGFFEYFIVFLAILNSTPPMFHYFLARVPGARVLLFTGLNQDL